MIDQPLNKPADVYLECTGCKEQHVLAHFYIDGFYHAFGMQDFARWIHQHTACSRNLAPSDWLHPPANPLAGPIGLHFFENRGFRRVPFRVVLESQDMISIGTKP